MLALRCPIQEKFLFEADTCMLNQLFGENKNTLFYDERGHLGVDIQTIGWAKYERFFQRFSNGKMLGNWTHEARTNEESAGFIPISAAHNGLLTTNIFTHDERNGWGMIQTFTEEDISYRLLYWHIETPWKSLMEFKERLKLAFAPREVITGSVIAIAGNTGSPKYSTGPHLHLELQQSVNGSWQPIDPMPFFQDDFIIYHRYAGPGISRFFYKGKEIIHDEAKNLRSGWPQAI